MIRHRYLCAAMAVASSLALAGCEAIALPEAPADTSLAAEILQGDRPTAPEGACWAKDETPAIIETVTEQSAQEASVTQDAGYLTQTRHDIVQARTVFWFRAPCDADLTPDVIATLQRALAARGFLADTPSGLFDPATRAAIRAYQSARGLNSDRLSLAAARNLGIVTADFGSGLSE